MYKVVDVASTGKNLKQIREKKGISVYQVERLMGVLTKYAIYKWERGECLPTADNLYNLSLVYGVSMEELLVFYGE